MKLDHPLHFAPLLKPVIWGGDKIPRFKGIVTTQTNIGESWEVSAVPGHESIVDRGPLSGQSLPALCRRYGASLLGTSVVARYGCDYPLLIKFIDTAKELSVQVHPNDTLAMKRHGSRGKTEMWHIIDASSEACIYLGFKEGITPEDYDRLVAENRIMDAVNAYASKPGDTYYIPAGSIHAIGAGNLLVEIQESSDITYRIYDYGRLDADGKPRELHTAQARDAIDYTLPDIYRMPTPEGHPSASKPLITCDYFSVARHNIDGNIPLGNNSSSFMAIMSIGGDAVISWKGGQNAISRGDTLLLPAAMPPATVSGHATLIAVTCP